MGTNKTAREITPNRKPNLVTPSPGMAKQSAMGIDASSNLRQSNHLISGSSHANAFDSTAAKT